MRGPKSVNDGGIHAGSGFLHPELLWYVSHLHTIADSFDPEVGVGAGTARAHDELA